MHLDFRGPLFLLIPVGLENMLTVCLKKTSIGYHDFTLKNLSSKVSIVSILAIHVLFFLFVTLTRPGLFGPCYR